MGDVNQRIFLSRALPRAGGPVLEVGSKDYGNTTTFRDVFAADEYIGIDDGLAKYVETPRGQRKYLPYLMVHMLGTRS